MSKIAVLEATIVAAIMMSATAYVATFSSTSSFQARIDEQMEERADDFMRLTSFDISTNACTGETILDQLVLDGIEGDHKQWERRADQTFGPNIEASLLLHNGHGFYPLHSDPKLRGLTRETWYTPELQYAMSVNPVATLSGAEHLSTSVLALHDSHLVHLRGDVLRAAATWDSSAPRVTQASSAHALLALAAPSHAAFDPARWAAGVYWSRLSLDGPNVMLADNPAPLEFLTQDSSRRDFQVTITGNGPGFGQVLPRGLSVKFRLPPGWTDLSQAEHGWELTRTDDPQNGQIVIFTASTALPAPQTLGLEFSLPTNSTRLFHPIHASLSNGSLGESTFVFVNPFAAERDLPRSLYLTTPYPIRPGSEALFGAVLANGGDAIVVDHLDLEIPGGYDLKHHNGTGVPLFAKDFNITDPNGGYWTRLDDRHIRWHGAPREVAARSATYWSVSVPVTDDVNHFTAIEPPTSSGPTSTLRFENGFTTTSTRWGSVPGVIEHRVPPASSGGLDAPADGYPWSEAELGTGAVHAFRGDVTSTRAHLENTSSYRLAAQSSDLQRLQSSVANSSLSVESRLVPIGSYAHVTGNLESLLTTVSSMGATDMTLTLDMYSPISRGCAPTTSTALAVSGLPAESVTHSLIWDGGTGIPSVFAATDDGVVHRIGADGTPMWSRELDAPPAQLAKGDFGVQGRYVIAADGGGKVYALDPVTGDVAWSTQLAANAIVSRPAGSVSSLVVNATTGRILAATANGILQILDGLNGDAIRSYAGAGGFTTVAYGPGGSVYALATTNVSLYDAGLRFVREHVLANGLALAVGHEHLLVPAGSAVHLMDPLTLAPIDTVDLGGEIRLASSGDATGDGVDDIAGYLSTNRVTVVSGSTSAFEWTHDISWGEFEIDGDKIRWGGPDVLILDEGGDISPCAGGTSTYTGQVQCSSDLHANTPMVVLAAEGRVSFVSDLQGVTQLTMLDGSGATLSITPLEPLRSYTHVSHGSLGGVAATSLGDSRGKLIVYNSALADAILESTPSDRIGSFSWYIPTPEGGFFGTHLVIATLRWTDASSFEQEARLLEWFEVVAPDGKPVTNPAYRVVLVVQDRSDPLPDPGR